MNNWKQHLSRYQHSHPNLTLKECMQGASKTYKKKKHGGNPAAIIGAVAQAVPGTITGISDAIDQGRRTTKEFDRESGKLAAERDKNFQNYYRDLAHTRYWNPEAIKPSLRLKKFGIDPPSKINDPKLSANRERADDALYTYAEEKFYGK
jgi:hypothetical protein